MRVVLVLAVVLHLLVGVLTYASGLVVPDLVRVLLVLAWAGTAAWLGLAVVRRWRTGPAWPALLVPAGFLLLMVAVVSLGGAVLGWTA